MSTGENQPSEEELRAAYEAEIKKIRVEQVVLEQVVTLVNLGMRRTGLAPGTESERDPDQVRYAIEAVRAQLPLVQQFAPQQVAPLREALSQLQLAYVRIGGAAEEGGAPPGPEGASGGGQPGGGGGEPGGGGGAQEPPAEPPAQPGEPGPAQRSGRLWIPGQ